MNPQIVAFHDIKLILPGRVPRLFRGFIPLRVIFLKKEIDS